MTSLAAPATWIQTRISTTGWIATWGVAGALALVATLAYTAVGQRDVSDAYQSLADALLHGRLWVPFDPRLELVPLGDGRAYVPFPPIPALLYMPMLAVGLTPDSAVLTAFVGGVGVALTYLLVTRLARRPAVAAVITIGLAGSTFGWAAATAGTWLYAQVLAFTLAVGALHVAIHRGSPWVAGLLLGLAAGSRLPVGLLLPLVALPYWPERRRLAQLVAGVALVAVPVAAYNLGRFGSPFDFGYAQIRSFWFDGPVTLEPWYSDGILSLSYIPRSIGVMLFQGFAVLPQPPFLQPSVGGLAVAFSAPVFVLASRVRVSRPAIVATICVLLVMLPNWAHGAWGFWQYGYRFLIDAMPALLVLLSLAYRDRSADRWLIAAVLFGLASTGFGLWSFAAGNVSGAGMPPVPPLVDF